MNDTKNKSASLMTKPETPHIPGRIGQESICWYCKHAVPGKGKGCEWSKCRKPVKGWVSRDTIRTKITGETYTAHKVQACPKFERR